MSTSNKIKAEKITHEIALDGFKRKKGNNFKSDPLLKKISSTGTKLWMDTGEKDIAEALWKDEFSALTTNNTLANKVVQSGILDEEIKRSIAKLKDGIKDISTDELIFETGFIINNKIGLRLVEAFDAKVSVELHPALSLDMEKTIYYAHRYYNICPENFIIKIPLTPEGYLSVRHLAKQGMPINFTLGFSARQNYLAALISNPQYVNVFLGRLNSFLSDNKLGDGKNAGERVTIYTQRAIDEAKDKDSSIKTLLIGASIRSKEQISTLCGIDIMTIPHGVVKDFLESGISANAIENNRSKEYSVTINNSDMVKRFNQLCDIDDNFRNFTEKLLTRDISSLNGNGLRDVCKKFNVDLFHPFTDEETKKIRKDGKIPKIADWDSRIAIDCLMTESALQSFVVDQMELDQRIRGFI